MRINIIPILFQNLTIIFFLSGFLLTLIGVGLFVLKKLKALCSSEGERLLFSFGIGAGIAGYSVFVLASLQLLYPFPLYGLLAFLVSIAYLGFKNSEFEYTRCFVHLPHSFIEKSAFAILLIVLVAAFILALAPETGTDALTYHLAVPKLYLKHQGFYFIEGNVFSNLPFHTEMLFLIGLLLQGDIFAKGMAFVVLPVLLLGILQIALYRMSNNALPYLSMLIFATIPSVFMLSTTAYIDLYVALYAMGAMFSFFNWHESRNRSWLYLFSFFTGVAVSCKYSALFLPFLGVLGILWVHRQSEDTKSALHDLFIYILSSAVCGSPFYIKNWIMTGNPLYPFIYTIFGGKGLDPEFARLFAELYRYMGMGREWMDYILLPWNISFLAKMNSPKFDGVIGPLFLLVLPFLAGIKNKDISLKIILIYCVAYFLFWASSSQDIRYLTPILPFLALLVGYTLSCYQQQKTMRVLLMTVTVGCLISNCYYITRDFIRVNPLVVVLGKEDRGAFLSRSLPHYPMYKFANKTLRQDSKVFLVYMRNLGFLSERDYYSDSMFEDYTLRKILSASSLPEEVRQKIKNMGITHIMYDDVFVTGKKSLLSQDEKSLFSLFQRDYLRILKSDFTYGLYQVL